MTGIKTHPGEVSSEEFMIPHGMSSSTLARAIDVPEHSIAEIISAVRPRAITPDMALRLSRHFRTTPEFWMNLQRSYDLSVGATLP